MPLLTEDDFYSTAQTNLVAAGFLFTMIQRHEPTVIEGTTPKGVAFTLRVVSDEWRLTYGANPPMTGPVPADWWLSSVIETRLREAITAAEG